MMQEDAERGVPSQADDGTGDGTQAQDGDRRSNAAHARGDVAALENKVVELERRLHEKDALLASFMSRVTSILNSGGRRIAGSNDGGGDECWSDDAAVNEEQLQLLQTQADAFSSFADARPSTENDQMVQSIPRLIHAAEGVDTELPTNRTASERGETNVMNMDEIDEEKPPPSTGTRRRESVTVTLFGNYTFQNSLYFMFVTEDAFSAGFIAALVIMMIAVVSLILVIVYAFKNSKEGNPLDVPAGVSPNVRAAQVLGAILGIITEQETVQGISLLYFGFKKSLQLNTDEAIVPVKRRKVFVSATCFLVVGYLFLINLVFVIAKADDVLALFFDIVALEFILRVDDLAFWLAKSGIFGKTLERATARVLQLEVVEELARGPRRRWWRRVPLRRVYFVNLLVVFLPLTAYFVRQNDGSYGCSSISVTFRDESWEEARVKGEEGDRVLLYSYFSGVYKREGTHDGYPRYQEMNKEDFQPFDSTIGAEIVYCRGLRSWVFRHRNIFKSPDEAAEEEVCNWLAKSAETESFDLAQSATEDWSIWVGSVQTAQISIICNECESALDCNFHGKCQEKECVCDTRADGSSLYFGQQCQLEMPCEVLINRGSRSQLLMVKSNETREQFVMSYNRPIYTYNGISGIPGILSSIHKDEEDTNRAGSGDLVDTFEDDDFFADSLQEFDENPLADAFFDFSGGIDISVRNYAIILAYSGSRWFATVDKPDLDIRSFYDREYHAFWRNTYSERTFLVSGPTSNGSPIGVEFFSPRRRRSDFDYGRFGVLIPLVDISGVGFFQCYPQSDQCTFVDLSVSTQGKALPSNVDQYHNENQRVSWNLQLVGQNSSLVVQQSSSVLLGAMFNHRYCLADGTYTFQMDDSVCKSSWWDCEHGPGESGYSISVGDEQIMETHGVFDQSQFTFSVSSGDQHGQMHLDKSFCSDKANVNITIRTDELPFKTSLRLTNDAGHAVLVGGPYPYHKTTSTYNHLACVIDGSYDFTLDGLGSPGYYNLQVGGEYLVKEGESVFDNSSAISFNVMGGSLFNASSTPPGMDFTEDHDSLLNCSVVHMKVSRTKEDASSLGGIHSESGTWWSLLDVAEQTYIFEAQNIDLDEQGPLCLKAGAYAYTIEIAGGECFSGELTLLDGRKSLALYGGQICRGDRFAFLVKNISNGNDRMGLGTGTALDYHCMDDFHLTPIASSDEENMTTNITSWELSGHGGTPLLRGEDLGSSSTSSHNVRACLGAGTYVFTTRMPSSDNYYISYRQSNFLSQYLDLEQHTFRLEETSDEFGIVRGVREYGLTLWKESKFVPSDGSRGDRFGAALAIEGRTLVIAADRDDDNGYDSGSAYIFIRDRDALVEYEKLLPNDGDSEDSFGTAIVLQGDTLVISAAFDDGNGMNSGSVYVFVRGVDGWEEQAKLMPSSSETEDEFGWALALDGDTLMIAAPARLAAEKGSSKGGSVYVFVRHEGKWKELDRLFPSDGWSDDEFGRSLALDGSTLVVGAHDDADGYNSGGAYVFTYDGEEWNERAKLLPADGAEDDYFGQAVALEGETIVITAHFDDNDRGINSGSAYIFERNGDEWVERAKIVPHDGAAEDYFGTAAVLKDNTLVVTAPGNNGIGAAYIFIRDGDEWNEKAKVSNNYGSLGDQFGSQVALDGDTLVIAAVPDDDNGVDTGSVYSFSTPFSELVRSPPAVPLPRVSTSPAPSPGPHLSKSRW